MNIVLKTDFFGFPQVKWLHLTGEVDKSVRCSCKIFSGFNISKIIKIGQFLTELFKKQKGGRFLGHMVVSTHLLPTTGLLLFGISSRKVQ